jgi:catechol 2,3-dioxygenase-like lactoylglutathione lyase family enzyme
MLDHVSIPVADLGRAAAFYDAVLATIGLRRRKERPGAIGYGPDTRAAPVFWILARSEGESAAPGVGLHVSFQAFDRSAVDAFHATALRSGGRDAGAPGVRPHYTMPFYGAFVLDLDGFKIEAVCRAPDPVGGENLTRRDVR